MGEMTRNNRMLWAGLVLLVCVTALSYARVYDAGFISMDDPVYVTNNPFVSKGISREGIRWAFDFGHEAGPYWMPVTMISHMLDCDLFGMDAAKHHLHNLVLHSVNVVLVFLFFYRVTGDGWRSLMVSALFALHPLNVESVAWVTSRKNVLSTLFWLLTMLFYIRYLKNKGLFTYLPVFVCFALGLMSKASVITVIFSLMLLDIWPFYRFILFTNDAGVRMRVKTPDNLIPIVEKIPLLVFTGLVLYIDFSKAPFASQATSMAAVPMALRLANAVTAYGVYVTQVFFPLSLSVHYPYPDAVPWLPMMLSLGFIVGVSGWVLYVFREKPWFFVGWCWFLGNLFMVSGLIQGGTWPAHADRFMYVAGLGLFIMICWAPPRAWLGKPLAGFFVLLCLILAGLTWTQTGYWKDSIRLFRHGLAVNPDDMVSRVNLAFALDKAGLGDEAAVHYRKILSVYPQYAEVHSNLGVILAGQGNDEDALMHFSRATSIKPELVSAWLNAGMIREKTGDQDRAITCYEQVVKHQPDNTDVLTRLTRLLVAQGDLDRAAELYEKALLVMPDAGMSLRYNLACVYAMKHQPQKALSYLKEAVDLGFNRWDIVERDPQLDNLRPLSAFQHLVDGRF